MHWSAAHKSKNRIESVDGRGGILSICLENCNPFRDRRGGNGEPTRNLNCTLCAEVIWREERLRWRNRFIYGSGSFVHGRGHFDCYSGKRAIASLICAL